MASRFLPSRPLSCRPSRRWPPVLFASYKPSPQDHNHPIAIDDPPPLSCSPPSCSPNVVPSNAIPLPTSAHRPSSPSRQIRLCFGLDSPSASILNGYGVISISNGNRPNGNGALHPGNFRLQQSGMCSSGPFVSKSSLSSPSLSTNSVPSPSPNEEILAREDPTCQPNLFSERSYVITNGSTGVRSIEADAKSSEKCLHKFEPNYSLLGSPAGSEPSSWIETVQRDKHEQNGASDDVVDDASMPTPFGEEADVYIPVKAFFISRRINLNRLAKEQFLGTIVSRNNLIMKWKDRPPRCPPFTAKPGMPTMSSWSSARYIVAFNYGSVVFFNFGENEENECLAVIRRYCTNPCQEAKNDDFDVLVRPNLEGWSQAGHDKVILKRLDVDNIRIVSSILGQSIALDHYGRKVDEMVNIFSELNQGMEKTGTFTMEQKALFKVVASANTTLADVILRIGILERSDVAWKDANYAALWEFLRDEFELDQRFESFDFKLEIIQHNVRFFLEVLQNRKSDTLEWIIIFLIAGEICVGLYDILHTAGYV